MRKILAGFLAAAMVASLGATMSFAATTYTSASVTAALADPTSSDDIKVTATAPADPDATTPAYTTVSGDEEWKVKLTVSNAKVSFANGESFTVGIGDSTIYSDATKTKITPTGLVTADLTISDLTAADIAKAVNGKSYSFNATLKGVSYTGKLSFNGANATVKFDQTGALPTGLGNATITLNVNVGEVSTNLVLSYKNTAADTVNYSLPVVKDPTSPSSFTLATTATAPVDGTGTETMDNDKNGIFDAGKILVRDVVRSYGDGTPIPLTEDKRGVDEALNDEGGVQSGKTLYFMIRDDEDCPVQRLNDDTYWKLKISKGDNGKYIKNIDDVTKIFSKDLYNANTGVPEPNTGADKKRHRYIKVELNEIYTDDEYKLTLDMRLSATSAAVRAGIATDDSDIKIKDFSFWMKNLVKDADNDWKVGIGGLMLNPLENDWNEVTYYDEDGDLAFMKFFADSDVSKFYAKLSTKWEHADYASYFNDQDAYIFDFVGSPKISATSRCDLEIYNPFINDNGDETIDPSTAVIYQVIDGDLFDVTDSFTYKEGENGDMAYITRTRFLGTYIICEKAVEEAVDNTAEVPADLVPEDTTPSEVTPDNNGGGKAPANTGKYF